MGFSSFVSRIKTAAILNAFIVSANKFFNARLQQSTSLQSIQTADCAAIKKCLRYTANRQCPAMNQSKRRSNKC